MENAAPHAADAMPENTRYASSSHGRHDSHFRLNRSAALMPPLDQIELHAMAKGTTPERTAGLPALLHRIDPDKTGAACVFVGKSSLT